MNKARDSRLFLWSVRSSMTGATQRTAVIGSSRRAERASKSCSAAASRDRSAVSRRWQASHTHHQASSRRGQRPLSPLYPGSAQRACSPLSLGSRPLSSRELASFPSSISFCLAGWLLLVLLLLRACRIRCNDPLAIPSALLVASL